MVVSFRFVCIASKFIQVINVAHFNVNIRFDLNKQRIKNAQMLNDSVQPFRWKIYIQIHFCNESQLIQIDGSNRTQANQKQRQAA